MPFPRNEFLAALDALRLAIADMENLPAGCSSGRDGDPLFPWRADAAAEEALTILSPGDNPRAEVPQLDDPSLNLAERTALRQLWRVLKEPFWLKNTPFGSHWRANADVLLQLLAEVVNLLTGQPLERFADFSPKGRKLLLALEGKGKVDLKTAFRAVHGRKTMNATGRQSFLTLVRRTSDSLSRKGYSLMIDRTVGTLELISILPRPGQN
jgi:hypothetical protein